MYTPSSFEETDLNKLHDFIEQHSFATLVSGSECDIHASHLPLLLDRDGGSHGRLVGHMARANPQWRDAATGSALSIFHGPHAYISPTWYQDKNVVPTWNYVAVHATGKLKIVDDRSGISEIVRRYVDVYEAGLPTPWSIDSADADFIDGLIDSVVGFEITIDRLEGKWKLNQNQDERRRRLAATELRKAVDDNSAAIATMMEKSFSDPS